MVVVLYVDFEVVVVVLVWLCLCWCLLVVDFVFVNYEIVFDVLLCELFDGKVMLECGDIDVVCVVYVGMFLVLSY